MDFNPCLVRITLRSTGHAIIGRRLGGVLVRRPESISETHEQQPEHSTVFLIALSM